MPYTESRQRYFWAPEWLAELYEMKFDSSNTGACAVEILVSDDSTTGFGLIVI